MATIAPAPLPSKPFVRYQSVLIPLVQFLQALPPMLVSVFLGRNFLRGLLAGALKG